MYLFDYSYLAREYQFAKLMEERRVRNDPAHNTQSERATNGADDQRLIIGEGRFELSNKHMAREKRNDCFLPGSLFYFVGVCCVTRLWPRRVRLSLKIKPTFSLSDV